MDQEKWISEIMQSANGIQRVSPRADLFQKIERRTAMQQRFSKKQVYLAAASLAVLILLNFEIVAIKRTDTNTVKIVQSISKSNYLY